MDAVEAAARVISRDIAARKGNRSSLPPKTRRLRAVGPGEHEPGQGEPTAADEIAEESWPSISWLRP